MNIRLFILKAALTLLLVAGFPSHSALAATQSAQKTAANSGQSQQSSAGPNQPASGGGNVQGYAAVSPLQYGTIVQLVDSKNSKVDVATNAKANQMYGVTVDPHDISITITNSGLLNEVFVATSGTYNVLVSNENGPIAAGDYLAISSIDGTAMKAGTNDTTILGRAVAAFDGKTDVLGSIPLKDTSGQTTKTANLGEVPVTIGIMHNPNQKSTKANVPKYLQRLGEAVAEKPVSPIRIYLSIFITGVALIAAIILLYSGVRNGLFSIGRNPLSKKSIFRALLEIIFTSFIILLIGLFAVYLLLKL